MWRNKNKIDSRISDLELQIKDLNNLNDVLAKEYYGMKNVVMKRLDTFRDANEKISESLTLIIQQMGGAKR
jgi:hypothetical protein